MYETADEHGQVSKKKKTIFKIENEIKYKILTAQMRHINTRIYKVSMQSLSS